MVLDYLHEALIVLKSLYPLNNAGRVYGRLLEEAGIDLREELVIFAQIQAILLALFNEIGHR